MSEACTQNCGSCSQTCADRKAPDLSAPANKFSKIKKVIGIVSGKGGVGKSLVTALSAVALRQSGFETAILDADITGPSIPKMFGLTGRAVADENGIFPAHTQTGIKVMSLNLLTDRETDPVVWRGPVIASTVKQFWSDVLWGSTDVMFIDMPPGTGDVPLTVFQSLPIDGIIVVTSPQELVSMIVEKALNMAQMMHIPVLGLVENMSYVQCPDCDKKIFIYGQSHIEKIALSHRLPVLGQLPFSPEIAALCDQGAIEKIKSPEALQTCQSIRDIVCMTGL